MCAFRVLQRTFGEGAYADRAFRAEADRAGLDARDRAFAQRLAYGAIQNQAHARLRGHGALVARRRLDRPAVLNALRLGIYQVALLDGVPDHAAVDQTVELAKQHGHGGHRLVNAVMRRATREAGDLIAELTDDTPAEAAVQALAPRVGGAHVVGRARRGGDDRPARARQRAGGERASARTSCS